MKTKAALGYYAAVASASIELQTYFAEGCFAGYPIDMIIRVDARAYFE